MRRSGKRECDRGMGQGGEEERKSIDRDGVAGAKRDR